ncbi:concanavalin A-like lectin/glucanase domain-containing protein [Schizothecium vesticola]|uniref:Concanavalin A-like lectin/glucanase domain-containing protein n=1 Tax=Schizothecium vesticola TaxID=314040 RepID=A0AA40F9R6_9PEZI|nr:concanavalin A-like lectin/glucanase domain-containing protein [Schizothecium vesticola]
MVRGIAHLALAALLLHGTAAIGIPSGFSRIVFEDDFSNQAAGSLPSTSKWTYSTGTSYPGGPPRWGTNEIQTYTSSPQNVAVTSSGTLRITPLNINGQWTSARLESAQQHDVACPEGGKLRIEASIKFGSAPAETQMGIWPSFWAMGAPFRGQYAQWPAVGEIDIAESVSGVSRVWNVLHCGWVPGGPCDEYNGKSRTSEFPRGEFGTFAVEIDRSDTAAGWRGETVTWFIDGVQNFRISGAEIDVERVWTAVTRNPKFLILNVAVGGDFPDNVENPSRVKTPTSATRGGEGASMEVRYVAVFST